MSITTEQLEKAVADAVRVTVNGKIDKLNQSMGELRSDVTGMKKDMKAHIDVVQPIIEQFNDRKGFWNTLSISGKNIALVSGALIGIGIIYTFLKRFF